LPVRRNGSLNLLFVGERKLTLQGLAGCRRFSTTGKEALITTYPELFTVTGQLAVFCSSLGIKDIKKLGDKKLLELWKETHQAKVLFREEKNCSGGKKIIAEIRHFASNAMVAEYELIPGKDGFYQARRLNLSPQQLALTRGKQIVAWLLEDGPIPGDEYSYPVHLGSITIFYYNKSPLRVGVVKSTTKHGPVPVKFYQEGKHKYVRVEFSILKHKVVREYQLYTSRLGYNWAEETKISQDRLRMLPAGVRDLVDCRKDSVSPRLGLDQAGIDRETVRLIEQLALPVPRGLDMSKIDIARATGLSEVTLDAIYNGRRPSTRQILITLDRFFVEHTAAKPFLTNC